jgi:hypothetical protein
MAPWWWFLREPKHVGATVGILIVLIFLWFYNCVHQCGIIKSALILLMHGTNMKIRKKVLQNFTRCMWLPLDNIWQGIFVRSVFSFLKYGYVVWIYGRLKSHLWDNFGNKRSSRGCMSRSSWKCSEIAGENWDVASQNGATLQLLLWRRWPNIWQGICELIETIVIKIIHTIYNQYTFIKAKTKV